MAVYQKTKPYNPDIQVQAMRARYPQFTSQKRKNGDIVFTGELHVKPELPIYTVQIVYRGANQPRIFILDPLPVVDAPHIYPDIGSLCLYHPSNYNWTESKLIAHDIIGWTAGWIYFYEYWLQNDNEWIGPEVPHML